MIHNPQISGTHLPALTNPAGAAQILNGYQAINADGEIVTGTIPSQGAQTITPGTSAKTIAAGRYLSGTQTISGDSDLRASNIKSGVNIFGVTGTFEGSDLANMLVLGEAETVGSGFTKRYQYELSAPNGWTKCAFFCKSTYGFIFNSDGTFFAGSKGNWNTSVSGDTITLSILPVNFGDNAPSEAYVIFIK